MSYPIITDEEATPEQIKALLDKGEYIYIPTFPDGERPILKDRETGVYIYIPGDEVSEQSVIRVPATMEGLTKLTFLLLFAGCNHV